MILLIKKKILKIDGNIFDSTYKFKYFIDYEQPNIQNVILELKNPNLTFENSLIEDFYSSNSDKNGKLNIEFLNSKNILKYKIIGHKIDFSNEQTKNSLYGSTCSSTLILLSALAIISPVIGEAISFTKIYEPGFNLPSMD